MPRFTLHRPKTQTKAPAHEQPKSPQSESPARVADPNDAQLEDLRSDPRVKIIDEMPRLLLIECPEEVAAEWLAKMPGWKRQVERRAKMPDPRPKLK